MTIFVRIKESLDVYDMATSYTLQGNPKKSRDSTRGTRSNDSQAHCSACREPRGFRIDHRGRPVLVGNPANSALYSDRFMIGARSQAHIVIGPMLEYLMPVAPETPARRMLWKPLRTIFC